MMNIGLINSTMIKTMDKLEARVRIFEFLYNIHFHDFNVVRKDQIDELVNNAIEIANKLYEEE